jgi:hypothetical protein
MLVWFLSGKRKEIVTGFLGLILVQEATGEKYSIWLMRT